MNSKLKKHTTQAKRNTQPHTKTLKRYLQHTGQKNKNKGYHYQQMAPKRFVKAREKGEIILGTKHPNTQSQLIKITKEEQKHRHEKIKEKMGDIVKINALGKGVSLIVSGGARGIGKSVLMGSIGLDQMSRDRHMMIVDPQCEIRYHEKPNQNKKHQRLFQALNLEPKGHPELNYLTPAFLKDRIGFPGKVTQLDSDNLTYNDLVTLIGDRVEQRTKDTQERFKEWIIRYFEETQNYNLEDESLPEKTMPPIQDIKEYLEGRTRKNDKILRAVRGIIGDGVLGKKHSFIDPITIMEKGDIPVIQTSTMNEWKPYIDTYLAPMLREIYRQKDKENRGKNGRLGGKGFTLQVEELDTLYKPKQDTNCRKIIQRFFEAGRQIDVGLIATAPSFSSIANEEDSTFIQQPNFLITGRVTTKADQSLLVRRLGGYNSAMRSGKLSRLKNLDFDKDRLKKGMAPGEFAYITPSGDLKTFYPLPPTSNYKTEPPI